MQQKGPGSLRGLSGFVSELAGLLRRLPSGAAEAGREIGDPEALAGLIGVHAALERGVQIFDALGIQIATVRARESVPFSGGTPSETMRWSTGRASRERRLRSQCQPPTSLPTKSFKPRTPESRERLMVYFSGWIVTLAGQGSPRTFASRQFTHQEIRL
jgi:hypothetical protein